MLMEWGNVMIRIMRGEKQDVYADKKHNFAEWFNRETGAYVRSGVIKDGVDTGDDPFMRSYPALIDVGVMGHTAFMVRVVCALNPACSVIRTVWALSRAI